MQQETVGIRYGTYRFHHTVPRWAGNHISTWVPVSVIAAGYRTVPYTPHSFLLGTVGNHITTWVSEDIGTEPINCYGSMTETVFVITTLHFVEWSILLEIDNIRH